MFRIRIRSVPLILGLLDPDPLQIVTDPDPYCSLEFCDKKLKIEIITHVYFRPLVTSRVPLLYSPAFMSTSKVMWSLKKLFLLTTNERQVRIGSESGSVAGCGSEDPDP